MISISKRYFTIPIDIRRQRHAVAVKYVYNLLKPSFDIKKSVEGSPCSFAITRDNMLFLPIYVTSAVRCRSASGKNQYTFVVSHRKNCITILLGRDAHDTTPNPHNTWLRHVDASEMKRIESSTTVRITEGCNSDKKRPKIRDLKEFISHQIENKSLLETYDNVMRKTGERHKVGLRNGRIGEVFAKSCLEMAGFVVEFPEIAYQPVDLITHTIISNQKINLRIQVKYTSSEVPRANNTKHVYKVQSMRKVNGRYTSFSKDDYDVFFVCIQTRGSDRVDFVYCIPTYAMVDAQLVSYAESHIQGKQGFYLAPMISENDHEFGQKYCKYYGLNKYKVDVTDANVCTKLSQLLRLAANHKI